jgi:hypothetical protein
MVGACKECDRLWQEYAEAIRAHLKIIGQHHTAMLQQSSGLIAELEPLCRELGHARALARQAVKDHEAAAHKDGAAPQG